MRLNRLGGEDLLSIWVDTTQWIQGPDPTETEERIFSLCWSGHSHPSALDLRNPGSLTLGSQDLHQKPPKFPPSASD